MPIDRVPEPDFRNPRELRSFALGVLIGFLWGVAVSILFLAVP
jgi:hypothetical protein